MIDIKIKNLNEILANITRVSVKVKNHYSELEEEIVNDIYDDSQKLVPVATGRLKDSAIVEINKNEETSTISYNTKYAIYVHEDLNKTHLNGTTAKFLEIPFNIHTSNMKNKMEIKI